MHIVYNKLLSVYAKSSQDNYCGDLSYKTIEAFRQNQFDEFVHCMNSNLQAFEDVFRDKLINESFSVFQNDVNGRIPRLKNQSQDDYDLYGEYDIDTILNTPTLSENVLDYSLYRIHHMFYRCLSFGTVRPDPDYEIIDRCVQWFIRDDLLDFNQIFSNFTCHLTSSQNPVPLFQSLYHHYADYFTQNINPADENNDKDNHHNHNNYRGNPFFLPDNLDVQTWKNTLSQIKIIGSEKVEQLVKEKTPLLKIAFERANLYQRLNTIGYSEENKSATNEDELNNNSINNNNNNINNNRIKI